jgi:hypothetical protein
MYFHLSTALRIIPWNKVLLQKLIFAQLPKKFQNFWSPKLYYLVHNSSLLVFILNQINPLHALTYFFKISFNIILQSMRICQVAPLLQIFLLKTCITTSKEQTPTWEAKRSSVKKFHKCHGTRRFIIAFKTAYVHPYVPHATPNSLFN